MLVLQVVVRLVPQMVGLKEQRTEVHKVDLLGLSMGNRMVVTMV
jgi:hypothetical protein